MNTSQAAANGAWLVFTGCVRYTKNLQPYIQYATVGITNPAQYLLYLQSNWTNSGLVGSGVECYGPAVTSGTMTCLSEAYGYDSINRLTSAGDSFYQNPSSGSGYSRNFQYDAYGNMAVSSTTNGPYSGLTPMAGQTPFNTANNRLNARRMMRAGT